MEELDRLFAENPITDIIDTHAHYDDDWFGEERYALLDSMPAKHVKKIIAVGCSVASSKFALELTRKYPFIYASAGVHPENCDNEIGGWLDEIERLLKEKKVAALGEIGLDYHYEGYDREKEIFFFEEQLKLAQRLDMPVIIHSRDATQDTMELLHKYKPRGVMHCFSGSAETARELVKLGMYVSFTGVLTFKNSKKAVEACGAVPIERLLLETDSPYMAPEPFRGRRNDSSLTFFTAAKLAEIKGLSVSEAIEICNANAERLFGI